MSEFPSFRMQQPLRSASMAAPIAGRALGLVLTGILLMAELLFALVPHRAEAAPQE